MPDQQDSLASDWSAKRLWLVGDPMAPERRVSAVKQLDSTRLHLGKAVSRDGERLSTQIVLLKK